MNKEQFVKGQATANAPVRLLYPVLINPKPVMGKGDPKYQATLLMEPDVARSMGAIAMKVANVQWPGRQLNELHFPFISGDAEAARLEALTKADGKDRNASVYRGLKILRSRSKYAPQLIVLESGQLVTYADERRALAESKFYSGCYIDARVTFATYPGVKPNPDGVTAYLDMAIKLKDGPRLGQPDAVETFKHYQGTMTTENPLEAEVNSQSGLDAILG